jgi:phosphonoacetaldehyde hydrolase
MTPPSTNGLTAVVFDWAGTLIDFGSQAPMGAFVKLFQNHGVALSVAQARVPMGLPKWDHIRALGRMPDVAAAWGRKHGRPFDDHDVDRLYEEFTPMNAAAVREHATLIPGALSTIEALRRRGLRIGTTTGYNRPIMDVVLPLVKAQGFVPDNLVCAGDVPQNRPSPLGMYRCFLDLQVWPAHTVVKVDDTVPGLMEGRHAGCWTVAVAASGNALGLDLDAWEAMPPVERQQRLAKAEQALAFARPDFVVPSVAQLMPVIALIEERLRQGQRPAP